MRKMLLCLVAVALAVPVWAQQAEKSAQATQDFQTRINAVEAETQAQVEALAAQANDPDPAVRQQVDKRIEGLKQQGEIRRLEILLEQAQAEGDNDKAAEVQQALDMWRNPPQTKSLPLVPRDAAPASENQDVRSTH